MKIGELGRLGSCVTSKSRSTRLYATVSKMKGRPFGFGSQVLIPMYGPAVCCKGKPSERGTFGLAPMYQTYLWYVWNAPGHHGYERAFD